MYPATQVRPRAKTATFCFSVHADNDVSVLPNVVGVLAKRSLTPERLISTMFRHAEGELHVDFHVAGLDQCTAELLAKAMRRLICVRVVLTSQM